MSAKRIVVDPLMLEAINGSLPRLEVASGYAILAGTPVHVDGFLLPCTGYIEHDDGRIEKFGKWPPVEACVICRRSKPLGENPCSHCGQSDPTPKG